MHRCKHLEPWEEAIAAACHSLSSSSSHRIILCQHRLITSFSRFDLSTGFHSGSNSGHIHPSSPSSGLSFCLPPLTLCSAPSLFFCLSGSSSFLFLLSSCISPSRLLCLLFVSFSSSGGWRHPSPLWLPAACRGNNSCHSVVEKLTEKNEKKGENPAK